MSHPSLLVSLFSSGDVVVQRLQLKDSPYSSFTDACVKIYKTDGMTGFFRGFGATFVTSGIASAVWWAIYENVKNEMYVTIDRKERLEKSLVAPAEAAAAAAATATAAAAADASTPTLWSQLTSVNRGPQVMAGFIAGTITSVLVNPLDVVKTRLQVQDTYGKAAHDAAQKAASSAGAAAVAGPAAAAATSGDPNRYRNMFHGLYRIYVDEGVRGYWRGVMPKLVSRGPLSAMSSLLYEVVMHLSKTDDALRAEQQHKFQ